MPSGDPAVAVCPDCEGRGWILAADGGAGKARPCECRDLDVIPRLLETAGIPPRYQGCNLANFKTSHENPDFSDQLVRARGLAERYVSHFVLAPEGRFRESGLLFVGPPGTGKTHLATAVLRELIRLYRVRGLFVDFSSLLHRIQSTFDAGSEQSKHQVLEPVMDAEALVLDELGAQKPSPWVSDVLYLVLNARYSRRLPTLFTTNYRLEDAGLPAAASERRSTGSDAHLLSSRIPPSVLSRLYEMAMPILIEVDDFRREVKVGQHRI